MEALALAFTKDMTIYAAANKASNATVDDVSVSVAVKEGLLTTLMSLAGGGNEGGCLPGNEQKGVQGIYPGG